MHPFYSSDSQQKLDDSGADGHIFFGRNDPKELAKSVWNLEADVPPWLGDLLSLHTSDSIRWLEARHNVQLTQ